MPAKTKEGAIRAARKQFGADAVEGRDFALHNTGAGWEASAIEAANAPAKKARTQRQAKTAPEVRSFAPKDGETKSDLFVRLMRRPGGVTSAELEKATGWKSHSVRGLIGTMKKRGQYVQSLKTKGEPVRYHLPKGADSIGDVI